VSLDLDTILRVMEVCEAEVEDTTLISFVVPKKGGGTGQVFLEWQKGKFLKDYLRDPVLQGTVSLYQAAYSRILDHRNIRRRLTYMPQPGDELRFIRAAPIGEM
jgi:integrase